MNAPVKIPVRNTDIIAHFSLNGQYKWGASANRASWKFGRARSPSGPPSKLNCKARKQNLPETKTRVRLRCGTITPFGMITRYFNYRDM